MGRFSGLTKWWGQFASGFHSPVCTCNHCVDYWLTHSPPTPLTTLGAFRSGLPTNPPVHPVHRKVGSRFPREAFRGSPQEAAVLNLHLAEYMQGHNRSKVEVPYAVGRSQLPLLEALGMELPAEGAISVPHGFHKNLEESQLRQLRDKLVPGHFGLISVKGPKTKLLPGALTVQNPVMESKDVSRYPGSGISASTFAHETLRVFVMHDVSSVVGPHELTERLVAENPSAHLFVTGVNPHEAVVQSRSHYGNSHRLKYRPEADELIWTPTGHGSSSYVQPLSVTKSWHQSSSIVASNGDIYQVVLLDYRMGHCLWHLFRGDQDEQTMRSYPTGAMVQVPLIYTGTLSDEWMDRDFVTKMLAFGQRTTLPTDSNYLAKASGLRASGPFISARDCKIGAHLCHAFDPHRSWWSATVRAVYLTACFLTLNWSPIFQTIPDVYELIDESSTVMTIYPTQGGGWSPQKSVRLFAAIPNLPTILEIVSVATSYSSVIFVPKMLLGLALDKLWGIDFWDGLVNLWQLLDITWTRAALLGAVLITTAVLPTKFTFAIKELAGHFWRQLWIPGSPLHWFRWAVIELTGAPGHRLCVGAPGRGWLWQCLLTLTYLHELFPPFMSSSLTLFGSHSFVHSYFAGTALTHPIAIVFWPVALVSPFVLWYYRRVGQAEGHISLRLSPALIRPFAGWRSWTSLLSYCRTSRLSGATTFIALAAGLAGILSQSVFHLFWGPVCHSGAGYVRIAVIVDRMLLNASYGVSVRGRSSITGAAALAVLQALSDVSTPTVNPSTVVRTIVQPRLVPKGPAGPVYVSYQGCSYHDWIQAVRISYQTSTNPYPPLDLTKSCFFNSVAALVGETPHLWYSWFQSASGVMPAQCRAPYGEMTDQLINSFCSFSGFGYDITGSLDIARPAESGWPILHLNIDDNPDGTSHCTSRVMQAMSVTTTHLSIVLATMRVTCNDWYLEELTRANAASAHQLTASPFARAVFPAVDFQPFSRAEFLRAHRAAASVCPIVPQQTSVFWDFGTYKKATRPLGPAATWPSTFVFAQAAANRKIRGVQRAPSLGFLGPQSAFGSFATASVPVPLRPPGKSPHRAIPDSADNGPPSGVCEELAVESLFCGSSGPARSGLDNRSHVQALGTKARQPRLGTKPALQKVGTHAAVPNVSRVTELVQELESKLPAITSELVAVPLIPQTISGWVPDLDKAKLLAGDIRNHLELLGSNGSLPIAKSMDTITDYRFKHGAPGPIEVTLLFGCSGCGKTTETVEILRRLTYEERMQARIVSHTDFLRGQTKIAYTKLFPELRGYNFPTIGNILSEPSTGIVVFDDAGKYWGGVVDLVAVTNPLVRRLVINGDPLQGKSFVPVAGAMTERLPTMIEQFAPLATNYATISHRLPRLIADTLGLHTTSEATGSIDHVTTGTDHLVITSSPRYVQVLKGGGRLATTFMDVQGEEFAGPVELDITGLEASITDAAAYVGLTRSRTGVYIHGEALASSRVLQPPTGSELLNSIIYGMRQQQSTSFFPHTDLTRRAFLRHLTKCLPNWRSARPIGFVPDPRMFDLHTSAAHHDAVVDCDLVDGGPVEASISDEQVVDNLDVELYPRDSESRERAISGLATQQALETGVIAPLTHRRHDRATLQLSIEKRLRTATEEQNERLYQRVPREDMITMFDILVPSCPQWNDHCDEFIDRAILEYCSTRTEASVQAKLNSHDPDRTGSDVVISMKAQIIKKLEKAGSDAVGGQLIHEYDIHQTIADASFFRFLEEKVRPCFPDNVMFYDRESIPEHVSKVLKSFTFGRGFSGADVTGWDSGCDAGLLNFDRHVMQRVGATADFVDRYVRRRLTTRSQFGPMATMQNSGDRGTKVMNDFRNATYSSIVLRVEPQFHAFTQTDVGAAYVRKHYPSYVPPAPDLSETLDINGDDVMLDTTRVASGFDDSAWVAKSVTGDKVEFSGLQFSQDRTVTYSPYGLYYRCLIHSERGNTDPIQWRAYADLFGLVSVDSPYVAEIARMLLRVLPDDVVLSRCHPSNAHFIARLIRSPAAASWLATDPLRKPPPMVTAR